MKIVETARITRRKQDPKRLKAERDPRQGGGKFTRTAPAVRRARRRKQNVAARAARKANRQ